MEPKHRRLNANANEKSKERKCFWLKRGKSDWEECEYASSFLKTSIKPAKYYLLTAPQRHK